MPLTNPSIGGGNPTMNMHQLIARSSDRALLYSPDTGTDGHVRGGFPREVIPPPGGEQR